MRIRRRYRGGAARAAPPDGAGEPRPSGVRTSSGRLALVVTVALLATFEVPEPGPEPRPPPPPRWPAPAEYVKTTVAYDDAPDAADRLYLDLYRPTAGSLGPHPPVIVYLHSGGWFQGVRTELATPGASLGKSILAQLWRGYVIASVDYTSSFTKPFPQAVLDVKRAIRHLRANGFEQSRVFVAGPSAGGHLAVMVAVTGGVARFEPVGDGTDPLPTRVDGAVSLDGPLELRALQRDPWFTQSWYPGNEPGSAAADRFGPTLESGELVPAFVGCTDPRLGPSAFPVLTPDCASVVDDTIDDASPRRWVDAGDPPLYLVCNTANVLLPDSAHDNRPFATDYVTRHGGATASAWMDELEQSRVDPAIAHFTVDQHLDRERLDAFFDRA